MKVIMNGIETCVTKIIMDGTKIHTVIEKCRQCKQVHALGKCPVKR